MLTDEAVTARIPIRVYLDLDPGFNSSLAGGPRHRPGLRRPYAFVTIGLDIGQPDHRVPTCGLPDPNAPADRINPLAGGGPHCL